MYRLCIFGCKDGCHKCLITTTISLVQLNPSLFMDFWTGRMPVWPFRSWPLLAPAQSVTLSQIKRWPAASPASRSRLCFSWLSLEHKLLYLPDLVEASLNTSLLKGQQKTKSPCCSIHLSFISLFFFVCLIYSLSVSRSVSFPLSFHSSELNVARSVSLVSAQFFSLPSHVSLSTPFSVSVSNSFCHSIFPPFCCSDFYNDTAYPAVISLITFKQLYVAFSPSMCLPLLSLPLIACSFLCQCFEGSVFHYLTTGDKYSCSAYILQQMNFIHVGFI